MGRFVSFFGSSGRGLGVFSVVKRLFPVFLVGWCSGFVLVFLCSSPPCFFVGEG